MNLDIVKTKVLIPMIAVGFICGLTILMVAISSYRSRVIDQLYDKIEVGKNRIETILSNQRDVQLLAVTSLSHNPSFIEAVSNGDLDTAISDMRKIAMFESLNYGILTDGSGNTMFRIHRSEDQRYDVVSVSDMPQIRLALDGVMNSATTDCEHDGFRSSTSAPVFDRDGNVIATVTMGHFMNTRSYVATLKADTGCDITFFKGTDAIVSTLSFSGFSYLDADVRSVVMHDVLGSGLEYEGEVEIINNAFLIRISPLYTTDNEIIGLLLVAISKMEVTMESLGFMFLSSGVLLALLAITTVVAVFANKSVEKKVFDLVRQISHRDKLFDAVNRASVILLEIDETDDIRTPMISSMEIVGTAFNVDHVHLWRGSSADNGVINRFVREYSWVSDYAKKRSLTPKHIEIKDGNHQTSWMEKLQKNEHISGIVSEMDDDCRQLLKPMEAKFVTAIPLFLENQFWGMFSIDNIHAEESYLEGEVNILRSVSLMMANIVRRNALQNENLKIYYDALTGIYNRRYFDKSMSRIISSMSRTGSSLSLMMIDVDYFKKYNDTYGHASGDECLIAIAEVLSRSVLRVDDFVARYGGEEFVAVMPNTDKDGAIEVAKRILEDIRAAKIPHKASDVAGHITVSIGITSGTVTQHHLAEDFIQRADDMLYESKNSGRNKLTFGEME